MWINFAKFKVNGHTGYNLRPQISAYNSPISGESFSRPKQAIQTFKIRIFGARMLPQLSKIDLMDPYIKVVFRDGSAKPISFVSKVVSDNALNPDFDLQCEAKLVDFENTFLCLSIFDSNPGTDALVCHWAAPVSAVRSGYRRVALLDSNFNTLSRGLCHALVHVSIE